MSRPLIELVITDEDLPPDNIEYVDPVEKEEVAQFTDGFEGFIPDEEQRVDDNTIFEIVEEMPEFPGGEAALTRYLATEVKYLLLAQELGIEDRVYVRFVLNSSCYL